MITDAQTSLDNEKYDSALLLLNKILDHYSSKPSSLSDIDELTQFFIAKSLALYHLNRFDESEEVLRDVLDKDPSNRDALELNKLINLGIQENKTDPRESDENQTPDYFVNNEDSSSFSYKDDQSTSHVKKQDSSTVESVLEGFFGIIGVGIAIIFIIGIFVGVNYFINEVPTAIEEKVTGKEIDLLPQNVYYITKNADKLYNSGKYSEALLEYKKAYDLHKSSAAILIGMGMCYEKLGDTKSEFDAYKKAIEVDPKSKNAWYDAGNVLYNNDEYEDAIKYYDSAIEIDERFAEAWYNKGLALRALGKDYEAQYALAKAAR